MSLRGRKRVPSNVSQHRRTEDAGRRHAERQAVLLDVTSDLIRASELGELGRKTFEHVKSTFGAVVCTNYRLDPAEQRLRLAFVHGIPPEHLAAAQFLELGQEYCGTVAASRQPLVADKQHIAFDRNGGLVRELGATAYACYPLKASDGRLLGTFAVASTTRESFTDDEAAWLGTITNFLAQAWERFEAEQGLRASKARLQLALNAAQLGWWQYNPPNRVFLGDTRTKEIFDDISDETPIEEITKRVHPDDADRFRVAREAALDPVDPKPCAIEFRFRRRDGEVRWLEMHWLAYFESAQRERGAAIIVGTLADITERKEREEREHLLMREINHRAKNMLSVVHAIAHQTGAKNFEDFIESFSERIQALAANQDLLIRNEWHGVDVKDLMRAQLAPFADLVGSRIAIDGPKLRLNPTAAQAIGLALHELTTNAGKYGALSTETGRIDICWSTDGDTLTVSWTERDGPPVALPGRRGFGTVVMEAMTKRSVDGTVELDFAPSGVTWSMTCPAANAVEARERGLEGPLWVRDTGEAEGPPPFQPAGPEQAPPLRSQTVDTRPVRGQ